VSVWGQQTPLIWHIWGCFPLYRVLHVAIMTLLGICGCIFSFHPKFYTFEFRKWRSLVLVLASMYWIACLIHYSHVTGNRADAAILSQIMSGSSIAFTVGGGILLVGGGILLARVPERVLKPGTLDLSWWSHPIWHLFVISGFFAIHALILSVLHFIESYPDAICLSLPQYRSA
jgi:predicted membrane channel-forming protein YqfA (hemolysin III family)